MNNDVNNTETTEAIDTTLSSVSLDVLPQYPEFLSRTSTEPGILLNNPLADLGELRPLERFTPAHREGLYEAIVADLRRWNAPAEALAAVEELRASNSYAVVTGQQAGIATGPLYTIYKAIGAIRGARDLALLYPGHRFVPVFWVEGDDHDFEEARRISVLDRAILPVSLGYEDGIEGTPHVGDRKVSAEGVGALAAQLREALMPTDFTDEALDIVLKGYGNSDETLADGFARALYMILGPTPLVIVSSRNPGLKRLAADVIEAEAADPEGLFAAVTAQAVSPEGLPSPITMKQGGLFVTHNGERRALDYMEGEYRIRGTEVGMSRQEAAAMAREQPERFSPNVALRPIVQDAILPTAIYFGGPSEVAYLRQIRPGYARFGLGASAVAPRPFVTLLPAKFRRAVESTGLALPALFQEGFSPAEALIDQETDRELDGARERALEGLAGAFSELEGLTARIDPTLQKTLGAAGANAAKGVEDFAKRLRSALKKKQGTEIERLDVAQRLLLPAGKLQERLLNALFFIDKYGLARFREVLEKVELAPGVMQVVEI
jgi:bacillithiol biosynthesis cysteine-adding enzyme BshC